jgi:hypothetical protein
MNVNHFWTIKSHHDFTIFETAKALNLPIVMYPNLQCGVAVDSFFTDDRGFQDVVICADGSEDWPTSNMITYLT